MFDDGESLNLLHIRTHHEHLFLCIVNADSYRTGTPIRTGT